MSAVLKAVVAVVLVALVALGGVLAWLLFSLVRWRGYVRHKGLDVPSPGLRELLQEVRAVLSLAWWHVRALGRDGLRVPEVEQGPPVLCVHGFTQNGTNFWGLRRALFRRGRASRAVSLGLPGRSVERYALRLRRAILELADRYERFDVVAHSLGGVILRHVLSTEPLLAARIGRIITLGSPHRGTAYSRGLPVFLLPEVVQIARRSTWLAELPALGEIAPQARRFTVAGLHDLVVYPADTCHEPGAVSVEMQVGHAGLLARPEVIDLVVAALTDDPRLPEPLRC